MLALLLDLGLDPDERDRVDGLEDVVYSWGEPLRQCAILGQPAMAEILLKHGANANTNVYAASSAMYEAYARRRSSDGGVAGTSRRIRGCGNRRLPRAGRAIEAALRR